MTGSTTRRDWVIEPTTISHMHLYGIFWQVFDGNGQSDHTPDKEH